MFNPYNKISVCTQCGGIGTPEKPGSGGWELFLWCFVVPGILYSIWRRAVAAKNLCSGCLQHRMIPIRSKTGSQLTSDDNAKAVIEEVAQEVIFDRKVRLGVMAGFALIFLLSLIFESTFFVERFLSICSLFTAPVVQKVGAPVSADDILNGR